MKTLKVLSLFIMTCALGLYLSSCGDDDTPMTGTGGGGGELEPISSFQFEVDANDWRVVSFSNFSVNASEYAWDFGDGNTSSEEAPSHTYAAGGEYEVTLTASEGSKSKVSSKTVTITDPNEASRGLTGETSKVWKLSRDIAGEFYPLVVGPEDRSQIWWSLGGVEDIANRTCVMNEEYHFGADGTYNYVTDGTVWADAGVWAADPSGCVDENDSALMAGVNGDDLSAWGSGSFTFEYDPASATLTVIGTGAHIGLAKAATSEEVTTPQASVTYKVVALDTDGPIDRMTLETTIPGGYWQTNLVSYENPEDEPSIGVALPSAAFSTEVEGSTVSFTNTSGNADSYSWDFGDGNTSTEENPTHTYAADGSYTVILTARSSAGESVTEQVVIISANSVFSLDALTGGSSKSWKLNPAAGALAVGPGRQSSEWWASSADDVTGRACTFDDTYTFDTDGNFIYNANGDVWAEAYMGVDPAGCVAEADLVPEAQPWGSGTHKFALDGSEKLSITGTGAFIGLPKAFSGGEHAGPTPIADGTITYEVLSYLNDGTDELLVIGVDIAGDESAWWTFTLKAD